MGTFGSGNFGSGTFGDPAEGLAFADDAGSTDAVAVALHMTLAFTDNMGATDTMASASGRYLSVTDDTAASDTATSTGAWVEQVQDEAGASDAATLSSASVKQFTSRAGATDALAATRATELGEQAGSTDLIDVVMALLRSAVDDAGSLDALSLARHQWPEPGTVENAGAADTVSVTIVRQHTFTDSAGAGDSLTVNGLPAVLDTFDGAGLDLGADWIVVKDAPLVINSRHRNRERDWTAATVTAVSRCSVQPYLSVAVGGGAEDNEGREFTSTHMRLFAPPDTALSATSRVVYNGVTYEVDGEPARWRDLDGRPSHVEAALKRLAG